MNSIVLKKNGPIGQTAERLTSSALTEVGFIPKSMCGYGCKIYASKVSGHLNMVGIHSKSYGCPKGPQTVGVIFETEQMTLNLDEK